MMRTALLDLLECPFCGTPLGIVESPSTRMIGESLEFGALGCECCAYPVVDGIPVLRADDLAKALLKALDQCDVVSARATMLGVEIGLASDLVARMGRQEFSYAAAIEALSPNAEGTYFAYRFSDPTFYLAEGLLHVLLSRAELRRGRVVDLCGGSGHLTRVMGQCLYAGGGAPPVVADYFPWKLWLASRLVSPDADVICVDANNPLPFAEGSCSLVLCADAFEYIWHRRRLAEEMYRLLGDSGVVIITHAYNAWVHNSSMGMPLSPGGYARLGRRINARLFSDDMLRAMFLATGGVDLGHSPAVGELTRERSFTLVGVKGKAEYADQIFTSHVRVSPPSNDGEWRVNPLYKASVQDEHTRLTLTFPTTFYESEFGTCRAYLPEHVELPTSALVDLAALCHARPDLVERRVLLNLPLGYL